MWGFQNYGIEPDMFTFGKKTQVCGFASNDRIFEIDENVFTVASRINSTWGGNLTDIVRCTHHLQIIEDEKLIENAARVGEQLLDGLRQLAAEDNPISAVRGRGLMIAFDLPNHDLREAFYKGLYDVGLLAIRSGENAIRFRPALDFPGAAVDETIKLLRKECERLKTHSNARLAEASRN